MKSFSGDRHGPIRYRCCAGADRAWSGGFAIDENAESVQRIAEDVTQVMQGDAQDEAVLKYRRAQLRLLYCCGRYGYGGEHPHHSHAHDLRRAIHHCQRRSTVHAKVLERVGVTVLSCRRAKWAGKLAQRLAHTNVVDFIGVSDEYSILRYTR